MDENDEQFEEGGKQQREMRIKPNDGRNKSIWCALSNGIIFF
jgi:hypothetical protein